MSTWILKPRLGYIIQWELTFCWSVNIAKCLFQTAKIIECLTKRNHNKLALFRLPRECWPWRPCFFKYQHLIIFLFFHTFEALHTGKENWIYLAVPASRGYPRVYSRCVTFLIKVWNQTDRICRNSLLRYVPLKLFVLHDMDCNSLSQLFASVSAQQKEQAWNKLKKLVTFTI